MAEEKWREENDKLDKFYEREKKKLEKIIEEQKIEIDELANKEISEATEDRIKSLVKDLEKKMAIMDSEHQEEMDRVQDSHELEVARLLTEHRELTTKLSSDLRQKVEQLEVMAAEHSEAARALRDEMEEQLELRDETHALQLQEMAASHQARVTGLEAELRTKSDWGWDNEETEAAPMIGEAAEDAGPAIFGVPALNNTPHPASSNSVSKEVSLEDNPEWEYLRNILYEYMCGRQPLILAKVGQILHQIFSSIRLVF